MFLKKDTYRGRFLNQQCHWFNGRTPPQKYQLEEIRVRVSGGTCFAFFLVSVVFFFNSYRPRKCSLEIAPDGCDLQKRVTPLGGGAGVIGVKKDILHTAPVSFTDSAISSMVEPLIILMKEIRVRISGGTCFAFFFAAWQYTGV